MDALRPPSQAALARLNEVMTVEWTYNSNAIEGNTLSLREHFEVINHKDAIIYVERLAAQTEPIKPLQPLTPFHVRQIHTLVLARIDDGEAGKFRATSVRIAGTSHRPPEPFDVPGLMDE